MKKKPISIRLRLLVSMAIAVPVTVIGFVFFSIENSLRPTYPPPTPHFAVRYSVTGIAMVNSGYGHIAINQSGDVVGEVQTQKVQKDCCGNTYPILHAALWHQGIIRDLGSLSVGESDATGINANGEVIGVYDAAKGWRGFVWSHGKMQDLGTLGGQNCIPKAINASGQIVGSSDISRTTFNENGPGSAIPHAFLWSQGQSNHGQMTDLTSQVGNVGQDEETNAAGITDLGLIVGEVDVNGVIWDHGKVRRTNMDFFSAVNRLGHYAGDSPDGIVFVGDGEPSNIGQAKGYSTSLATEDYRQAEAINGSDQVVGVLTWSSGRAQAEGGQGWTKKSAFVWKNGTTWDLNSLIPANSGWELENAQSINDAGWIVGFGKYKGKEEVFLLKPL